MQSVDTQFLASSSNILRSQHSRIRRRFITVGLDFHTASHTADGFAATGITQIVSLCTNTGFVLCSWDEPEIGDVDEGVIEGGENTGDAEDEFTW